MGGGNLDSKAFTLIELLAIIVILAIIAVITIPIILNVIENSRKGAAIDSAYGYKDAVSKYYVSEMIDKKDLKLDGAYSVDKGTLKGKTEEEKYDIPTSGDSPSIGWIKIKDNEVTSGCLTIGDYKVELNDKDVTAEKGVCPSEVPICTYVSASETHDSTDQYAYGTKYECDPGDGEKRIFYVLENGDNTLLTKVTDETFGTKEHETDLGTAGLGEVALIMDRNIDDSTPAWCKTGSDNSCKADGAMKALKEKTAGWTVKVNLPTYGQLYAVNSSNTLIKSPWLYGNIASGVSGYWTSSPFAISFGGAWSVWYGGYLDNNYINGTTPSGIRPVITVSKSNIIQQ